MWTAWGLLLWWADYFGWSGRLGFTLVCLALPCAEAAGLFLVWPGYVMPDSRTPGGHPGLVFGHWQVDLGSRISWG